MTHRSVTTPEQADRALEFIKDLSPPYTIEVKEGVAIRGLSQNALLHKWYAEIAKARGDMSASDVKGECHQRWALNIRLRDKIFAWLWKETGAKLSTEKQRKLLASNAIAVSSAMTSKELTEYMDEIEREFSATVKLTIPEDRK